MVVVVSPVAIPFRLEAHWYGEVSGAEDAQECQNNVNFQTEVKVSPLP